VSTLEELLAERRICICAGPGGVGKTTTSAAIAMGMAARGRRVAVVTIDPAQRLADALGLDALSNEPRQVDPARFAAKGLELGGELWAMTLDAKRTFDELIARLAPDPEAQQRVLDNRIYQELSSAVAGSQEFTAIAKLYELDREGGFDLLVLDTPPSRNALDFLDAPDRISQFLEGRALRAFMAPTGLAARVAGRGTGLVFTALRRVTGIDLLTDLSEFFRALGGMVDGFKERASQVRQLLGDPGTVFLLVTSAEPDPVEEAEFLAREIERAGLPLAGAVVNRSHHDVLDDPDLGSVAHELGEALDAGLLAAVQENLADYHALAQRDREGVERLAALLGERPLIRVPQLDDDVHDVAGLLAVHRYLFADDEERAALLAEVVA
jgi:anion-transporting  ArsA/GET3 family ATPase